MADEEEQLRESLKNHPHLTLEELREFKELFNLVRWGRPPSSPSPHLAHSRPLQLLAASR